MTSEESAKRFFELNLQYNRMLEQAGTHVIVNGEDAVLYWLYAEDKPLLSGEISQRMELSSGRVANILNSLEKKGMIMRERNSADKRQVSVSLTTEGRKQIDSCYRECIRWCDNMLGKLKQKDVDTFLGLAEQILQ